MSRSTIDFGIDLGTTNSAVAVLEHVTQTIIKNNEDQDTTPSAVFIDRNGQVHVGDRAKGATLKKPNDAFAEFKRRMGTEFLYHFKASNQRRKPEELSAEILKALRADISRKLGEDISAVVVTVPAAFELHQCDATKKAAELAGLELCALLQEPVAAALAYGFQADAEKAYWLVYDFGGGTFDAALIKAQDGLINVVHHGGNNFLGGSDIDWAILEKAIVPALTDNFDLPDFSRSNARWETEMRTLKNAVEKAKIELTTKDQTTLDFTFQDDSGTAVEGDEITLRKSQVVSIAEGIVNQSVDICLKVLAEKKLGPAEIQKVILVGGPTKAPYFREILADRLGIKLDASVDPLTVVAKGAAVFAGTQRLDNKIKRPAKAGEFAIDLKYSPVGSETEPDVGGKVSGQGGESLEGFTIEFANESSKWRSGRIPLSNGGVFIATLVAEKGSRNTFGIDLFDSQGGKQKVTPDKLVYTVGAVVEEQPLIHSMGIELSGNEFFMLAAKGSSLPIKTKVFTVRTIKAVSAGEAGVAMRIPILEGDNIDAADRNKMIGCFELTGESVKRDLPAGAEIEVSLKIDESRLIRFFVYIPALDEEFEKTIDLRKALIDPDDISADWKKQRDRIKALSHKASEAQADKAEAAIEELEASELFSEIAACVKSAKGDLDAANKGENLLLKLKEKLDAIENDIELPSLTAQFNDWFEDTFKLAEQHGAASQQVRADDLREKADQAIKQQNGDRLRTLFKELQQLYFEILTALPQFWVNQYQQLAKRTAEMSDIGKAERLFDMGQRYLTENNVDGLRNVVNQLYDLLPKAAAEAVKRGYGSDVVR